MHPSKQAKRRTQNEDCPLKILQIETSFNNAWGSWEMHLSDWGALIIFWSKTLTPPPMTSVLWWCVWDNNPSPQQPVTHINSQQLVNDNDSIQDRQNQVPHNIFPHLRSCFTVSQERKCFHLMLTHHITTHKSTAFRPIDNCYTQNIVQYIIFSSVFEDKVNWNWVKRWCFCPQDLSCIWNVMLVVTTFCLKLLPCSPVVVSVTWSGWLKLRWDGSCNLFFVL